MGSRRGRQRRGVPPRITSTNVEAWKRKKPSKPWAPWPRRPASPRCACWSRPGPEGLPAGEIARRLEVPAPTLSFHLRALLHAGLVRSSRDGRSLYYAADYARLQALVDFLSESCCQARRRSGRARARA